MANELLKKSLRMQIADIKLNINMLKSKKDELEDKLKRLELEDKQLVK